MDSGQPIELTPEQIIRKILKAKKLEDILDVHNLKSEFKSIIKLIHPDVCDADGVNEATQKLTIFKDEFEKGITYACEVGEMITNGYSLTFTGNHGALEQSYKNYQLLKNLRDANSLHFHQYIPSNMTLDEYGIHIEHDKRAIPLSGKTFPADHVHWILNRMMEFSTWLAQVGFVHCGIHPESVFVIPENHGIQICLFPHLTRTGQRINTYSGAYQNWYPPYVFSHKKAHSSIDIELAKKTAIYLCGDRSGAGIKLRATHNPYFVEFLIKQHLDAQTAYLEYQQLIKTKFKRGFYQLDI